jgi:hypothetical protein
MVEATGKKWVDLTGEQTELKTAALWAIVLALWTVVNLVPFLAVG